MQRGVKEACTRLSVAYFFGDPGATKDLVRSVLFGTQACHLGDANQCVHAGTSVERGQGAPKSPEQALALYARGCDLGSPAACSRAGEVLEGPSLRDRDPRGERAEAFFIRAHNWLGVEGIRSIRCNACSPLLPRGRDGCLDALRSYREALDKATELTDSDREDKYGEVVRFACETIPLDDCDKYKKDLRPEYDERGNRLDNQ